MKKINIVTKFVLVFSILLIYAITITTVFAEENSNIVSRTDWNADEQLSADAKQNYGIVDKIYLTGVTLQDKQVRIDTKNWVKGLYYFFSTKTQLKDIPFNYLVSWDGTIYEGKKKENELLAPISGENAILIGYLSNYDTAEITSLGRTALTSLLNTLTKENDIKADDIQVKDWNIKPTDNLQETYIEIANPENSIDLEASLSDIKSKVEYGYIEEEKVYTAQIVKIEVASDLEIGKTYPVTLTLKNTGETTWYKDSKAEVTAVKKDGSDSEFRINEEWLSSSQVSGMQSEIVKSQEETTFLFNIETPFTPSANYEETFQLKTKNGQILQNSDFTIKANLNTSGKSFVEVTDTPTGFLNIRKEPTLNGELITQALPGERFILLETNSTGWYKVKTKNGDEGWAVKQYLKTL